MGMKGWQEKREIKERPIRLRADGLCAGETNQGGDVRGSMGCRDGYWGKG